MNDEKAAVLGRLVRDTVGGVAGPGLVVGCGSGVEAAVLAEVLGIEMTGIDLVAQFDSRAAARVTLLPGDATALAFPDETFRFVYSYHALEHIPQYRQALDEMQRVLRRPDGVFCIGTPNRSRLVGYLGGKDTSLSQKIAWNLADWSARARGRFRNEDGAHAGFGRRELGDLLARHLGTADDLTDAYYQRLYPRQQWLVAAASRAGLGNLLFPSVYFAGRLS